MTVNQRPEHPEHVYRQFSEQVSVGLQVSFGVVYELAVVEIIPVVIDGRPRSSPAVLESPQPLVVPIRPAQTERLKTIVCTFPNCLLQHQIIITQMLKSHTGRPVLNTQRWFRNAGRLFRPL